MILLLICFRKTLNWHINPITSISWLLVYLQSEYDLNKSSNSKDILQTSKLTKVHQSKDFLHLFSSVVRVRNIRRIFFSFSISYIFSYLIYVHWILNIVNFRSIFLQHRQYFSIKLIGH